MTYDSGAIPVTGRAWRPVIFAVGGNLGDVRATLSGSVTALRASRLVRDVQVSSWYESDPVGGVDQPVFLNAVIRAETDAAPIELLGMAYWIERSFGRTRDVHWGPRTCDLDVIAIGSERIDEPGLAVPHPFAHERAFVLVPWAEIAPDDELPGHGRVGDLARDATGVRRLDVGGGP